MRAGGYSWQYNPMRRINAYTDLGDLAPDEMHEAGQITSPEWRKAFAAEENGAGQVQKWLKQLETYARKISDRRSEINDSLPSTASIPYYEAQKKLLKGDTRTQLPEKKTITSYFPHLLIGGLGVLGALLILRR